MGHGTSRGGVTRDERGPLGPGGAGVEWDEAHALVDAPEMEGRLHCILNCY